MANRWKQTDFILGGSKITADGDCSHELKDTCSLEEKFDQPRQHIKKQRHYFANRGPSSQSYGFSSSHVCISLRVPWTARGSNQLILKEISPEYSLKDWCWSWNSNTLATWCEELTHFKRLWCWKRFKEGGEGDNRGWDGWMASPMRWTWVWVSSWSWWWTRSSGVLLSMGLQSYTTDQLKWTEQKVYNLCLNPSPVTSMS